MFILDKYLANLIMNCRSAFGERLLYMGLQGSYLRGEPHENSDIDIMVILDGYDFDQAITSLFAWCQNAFARIEHLGGK